VADRYSLKRTETKRVVPFLYGLVREYLPGGIGVFEGDGRERPLRSGVLSGAGCTNQTVHGG
jgi:hypothetical protein